jgi:3-phosphoshikimate 1-carboxyvinyltransferase
MKIIPANLQFSSRYLTLTDHVIKNFRGGNYSIPVDMSSLAYVLALAALCGTITVGNCPDADKRQADSAIFDIAVQMGVQVEWGRGGVTIQKAQKLRPVAIEISDCLDLVPALACLCSKADGVSILFGLKGLKRKESNRLVEIQKLLDLFSVKNEYLGDDDALRIFGQSIKASAVEFEPPKDHRMIMAAAIMMKANNGGVLHHETDVAKSFPGFFDLFRE